LELPLGLPQIFSRIYKIWSRPKITIVPSPTLFLSYTNLGPLVQLDASFSVARQDALIDRMEVEIIHELGERRHLAWTSLSDFGGQITVPTGEVMNVEETNPRPLSK
jgi:hypothetical protein